MGIFARNSSKLTAKEYEKKEYVYLRFQDSPKDTTVRYSFIELTLSLLNFLLNLFYFTAAIAASNGKTYRKLTKRHQNNRLVVILASS